ncbi:MAG: SRPBCC domain-containing protein [bacterium]
MRAGGRNVALEAGRRIEQAWRTTEFPPAAPDSTVVVRFEPDGEGTRLTLRHTGMPTDQHEGYLVGWEQYDFAPIRAWLAAGEG